MNIEKFTGKSEGYAKYRPSYPQKFIDYLYQKVGFSEDATIADIGSGTGIFTKQLLLLKSQVFGVEPNEDMRQTAEKLLFGFSKFVSVDGSAENTRLNNASVDFITAAQAFHWFDKPLFKAECQRILKKDGKVVLVWNTRDPYSQLTQDFFHVNKQYCFDFKGFNEGGEESPLVYANFFREGVFETLTFDNNMMLDLENFIGRSLSASYAPRENNKNYHPYIHELKKLFRKYSRDQLLTMPYLTKSYVGEV